MTDQYVQDMANNPKCPYNLEKMQFMQALEHYGFSPIICLKNWTKKDLRGLRSKYEKAIKPS